MDVISQVDRHLTTQCLAHDRDTSTSQMDRRMTWHGSTELGVTSRGENVF